MRCPAPRIRWPAAVWLAASTASAGPVIAWEPVAHPGGTAAIESVAFGGSSAGWMLQRDGTLLRSADAGGTWRIAGRLPGPVRRLAVAGDRLAVAGDGVIRTSPDAGRTWQESFPGNGGTFNAIAFGPDGSLWAAGMGAQVVTSADGGATWQPAGQPGLGHLFAICAGPGGAVLAGGLRGLWERRAGRWSYVNLERDQDIHHSPHPSITDLAVEGTDVWITGRIDDFAMLWRGPLARPATGRLVHHEDDYRYLRFARGPGDLFWTAGPRGFLARSANFGGVWSQEPPGIAGDIRALVFAAGRIWAAGEGGRLFRGRDPAAVPAPAIPPAR